MGSDPLTASMMAQSDPHGWLAPGRHAVASPSRWGKSYGIILVLDKEYDSHSPIPENARDLLTSGDISELREIHQDHKPRVRKIFDMVDKDDCRLWTISMLPDLRTWVNESAKVVLPGDAAHAMYPYLAQVCHAFALTSSKFFGKRLSYAVTTKEQQWQQKMQRPFANASLEPLPPLKFLSQ